jgi:hypothetical protein
MPAPVVPPVPCPAEPFDPPLPLAGLLLLQPCAAAIRPMAASPQRVIFN